MYTNTNIEYMEYTRKYRREYYAAARSDDWLIYDAISSAQRFYTISAVYTITSIQLAANKLIIPPF